MKATAKNANARMRKAGFFLFLTIAKLDYYCRSVGLSCISEVTAVQYNTLIAIYWWSKGGRGRSRNTIFNREKEKQQQPEYSKGPRSLTWGYRPLSNWFAKHLKCYWVPCGGKRVIDGVRGKNKNQKNRREGKHISWQTTRQLFRTPPLE